MLQFQINRAVDDLRYLRVKLTKQADAAPLSQRRAILEQIDIIDKGITAAHFAGKEGMEFPVGDFTDITSTSAG